LFLIPQLTQAVSISDFNPVSHWDCDETSGIRYDSNETTANDLTDNNTVPGVTGKLNNACDFESVNSEYLSITDGDQQNLDFSSTFSISAWLNRESSVNQTVVSKDDPNNAANRSWGFWVDGSGALAALIGSGGGTFDMYHTDTNPISNNGQWYHVALVANADNPSATTFEFYVDGTSLGNGSADIANNLTSIANGASAVNLGRRPDGGIQSDGLLDEISVFSTALSDSDITTLYNSGTPLSYTGGGGGTSTPTTTTSTGSTTLSAFADDAIKLGGLSLFGIFLLAIIVFVTYLIIWIIRA